MRLPMVTFKTFKLFVRHSRAVAAQMVKNAHDMQHDHSAHRQCLAMRDDSVQTVTALVMMYQLACGTRCITFLHQRVLQFGSVTVCRS